MHLTMAVRSSGKLAEHCSKMVESDMVGGSVRYGNEAGWGFFGESDRDERAAYRIECEQSTFYGVVGRSLPPSSRLLWTAEKIQAETPGGQGRGRYLGTGQQADKSMSEERESESRGVISVPGVQTHTYAHTHTECRTDDALIRSSFHGCTSIGPCTNASRMMSIVIGIA